LRVLKNLDTIFLEELIENLKVHEQKLQQDKGLKKDKSPVLKVILKVCI